MAIALSVLTILAALVPVIVDILRKRAQEHDALIDRSNSELRIGTDRVRQEPPL